MEAKIKEKYTEKLDEYYCNNGSKLYSLVKQIVYSQYGYVNNIGDFYSMANVVFAEIVVNDKWRGGNFDILIYKALTCRYLDYWKTEYRQKRRNRIIVDGREVPVADLDLYGWAGEHKGLLLYEVIESDSDLETEVINSIEGEMCPLLVEYLDSLTDIQRQMVDLMMDGLSKKSIMETLHLDKNQYRWNSEKIVSCNDIHNKLYQYLKSQHLLR